MLPGSVFSFNVAENRDINPVDIEPGLEEFTTVNKDNYTPEQLINQLFVQDYVQAENKNAVNKSGHKFQEGETTRRCIKVNPLAVKTDRDNLVPDELLVQLEKAVGE